MRVSNDLLGGRLHSRSYRSELLALCALSALALPAVAHAQTASLANEPIVLEDVVVTASKYAGTVQSTPIAVTALSGEGLEQSGISDVKKLSAQAPNVQMAVNGSNGAVDISMRGVTSNNVDAYSGSPAVSVHVDGVYVARATGLNATFYDIERVEILRGPQGTLYGRNATAGNVNIITTKPQPDFDAKSDIAVGNYGTVTAHGMINVPLTETLAMRATMTVDRNDGYIDTLGTTKDNYWRAEQLAARVALKWEPSDSLVWNIHGEYFQDTGTPNLGVSVPIPGTLVSASDGYGIYERPVTSNGSQDIKLFNLRSTVEYSFNDNLSVAYIAGYGRQSTDTITDTDGRVARLYASNFTDRQWSASHELNLRYASDRLKAVLGANSFYEHDRGDLVVEQYLLNSALHFPHPDFEQKSYGVFGQATYSLTDSLRVTGGLRYSQDEASSPNFLTLICRPNLPPNTPASMCFRVIPQNQQPRTWDGYSYRAGLDYDLNASTMLYGSISTGYKQGRLASVGAPIVRPETVTNYEIGAKNRWFGNTVTLNAAVFFMDYADLQVQQVVFVSPGVTNNITTNAAKASIYGVEIEGAWQITANDSISGYISTLDATYDKYNGVIDSVVDPGNTRPLDLSGNELIRSPKFSARVAYSHVFELGNGATLTPWISFYYQTDTYLRAFNRSFDKQDAYTRTDLRLTYRGASEKLSLEGYVTNLEDETVRVAEYEGSGILRAYYAPPRLYGVKLSYRY